MHSDAEPFRGKRVLVVGMGESIVDIVRDISNASALCDLVLCSLAYSIRRLTGKGIPVDARAIRMFYPFRGDSLFILMIWLIYILLCWPVATPSVESVCLVG